MKTHEDNQTEASVVSELARESVRPLINVKREGVAVFPDGTVVNLENELLADHPKRNRASLKLISAESFIEYMKRYKLAGRSVIFGSASETGGSFAAVVDYHEVQQLPLQPGEGEQRAGEVQARQAPQPGWGEHNVALELQATAEWKRWIGANNTLIPQATFAEFIEDNAADIKSPDAGLLLDMASFLHGKKTVTFKSARDLRTGLSELNYTEELTGENAGRREDSAKFPTHMIVTLRPFVGMAGVDITARLRFRISDAGKLSFQYVLDRPFKVIEAAFNALAARIESELQTPVLLGSGHVVKPAPVTGA